MGFEALTLAWVQAEILKLRVRRLRPDSTRGSTAFYSGRSSRRY